MPESRKATIDALLNDIRTGRGGADRLQQRITALRVSGLAGPSDLARLQRALEAEESADMFENMPV